MTVPRRPFLLEPGQQLLITTDAIEGVTRFMKFLSDTGLEAPSVVSVPTVTIPIPVYAKGQRFSTVHPEVLWNPLFWLPDSVALRFQVREEDGSIRPETDTEWAVRLVLELQSSGLYVPDEGWMDVLAMHGIDVDDPVDLARVEAWLSGEPDSALDGIDLTDMFVGEDEWAFREAEGLLQVLLPAQYALTARAFLAALDDADTIDDESLAGLIGLAGSLLDEEPSDAPDNLDTISGELEAGVITREAAAQAARDALDNVNAAYSEAVDVLAGTQ